MPIPRITLLSLCCWLSLGFLAGCASNSEAPKAKDPVQIGTMRYAGHEIPVFDGDTVKSERLTPPVYPKNLRADGVEGIGIVTVVVDETGRAVDCQIFSSSPHPQFGWATLAAAKRWRYFPMDDATGKPMLHALRERIVYRLR